MATQDIIIFEPSTSEETEALKAFGKALKLKFKIADAEILSYKKNVIPNEIESNEKVSDIPEWHKKILDERLKDYRKNPEKVKNFDELLKSKREKYGL